MSSAPETYLYVRSFLESQEDSQVLLDAYERSIKASYRKLRKPSRLAIAIWNGYWELITRSKEWAELARKNGHLLYCWEGTKVLEGGAA